MSIHSWSFPGFLQSCSTNIRGAKGVNVGIICIRGSCVRSTYIKVFCSKITCVENVNIGDICGRNACIKGVGSESTGIRGTSIKNSYIKSTDAIEYSKIHLQSFLISKVKLFDKG